MSEHKKTSESTKKKRPPNRPLSQLKRERELRGWSQTLLAELLDSSQVNVSRWEQGFSSPGPYYRRKLAELFGKSLEELGLTKAHEDTAKNNLKTDAMWKIPPSFTSFIGREQEITSVRTLLEKPDVRLVTLLGPPGVGKTRLSMQIAQEMRTHFVDGACFISLAAIGDPNLVLPTIADCLDIQEKGTASLAELIKTTLRDKHFLLLLDNFEQIVAGAPLIEELLVACPHLKVIVTSRVVLYLRAEYIFQVHSLKFPDLERLPDLEILRGIDSVTLFVQRAQAILHDFQITAANARTIAEICKHLDGLPLAIELAAARIKLLSPQALLTMLPQRLQLLKSEIGPFPKRQETLYQTIKWSYDLLDAQEQWLFRHLSVFNGSSALEAIEFFVRQSQQPTIDVLNTLSSLIDRSLLYKAKPEGEPRWTMLETVREFGKTCLQEKGEWEISQHTHALYYLQLAARAEPHLKDAGQGEWLARLESEKENLRATLVWLISQDITEDLFHFCETYGKFCGLRGYWSEARQWLETALARADTIPPTPALGKILRRAGHLSYRFRDLNKARTLLEKSVTLSRELDEQSNLAGSLSGLAWVLYRQKDIVAARSLLHESLEVARTSQDRWSLSNTLESLSRFLRLEGDLKQAVSLLAESVTLAQDIGDQENLARILCTLATIQIEQKQIKQAETTALESYRLAQKLGTKPLMALVRENLGIVALFLGEYERATDLFEERLSLARELDDIPAVAKSQLLLADVALTLGDFEHADKLAQEAITFFQEQGDNPNIALSLNILGAIKLAQGAFTEARQHYREALTLDKGSNKQNVGKHLIGLARVAQCQEQPEKAARLFGAATSLINPDADMHPTEREIYNHAIMSLRMQLGDRCFEDTWSSGVTMGPEQALECSSKKET